MEILPTPKNKEESLETRYLRALMMLVSRAFSFFIFLTILALLFYTGVQVYEIFVAIFNGTTIDIIHDIALVIVLIKAYRVLLFYFRKHHISIKYIVEISIIAPAIEIIFAANPQEMWVNTLLAVFSLANLFIYAFWHDRLNAADNRECHTDTFLDDSK